MRKYLSAAVFALVASFSIPTLANESAASPTSQSAQVVSHVNLNSADAETLHRELSGIGAAKAKAIVDYREEHGPFQSVDELLEVKGIGASILERNKAKLQL
jgi:competence protein ComEA